VWVEPYQKIIWAIKEKMKKNDAIGHDGKPWPQTTDANTWATDIVIVLKIFATHFLFWFFIISMLDNFAC